MRKGPPRSSSACPRGPERGRHGAWSWLVGLRWVPKEQVPAEALGAAPSQAGAVSPLPSPPRATTQLPRLLVPWDAVPRRGCGGRGSHRHQPPLRHRCKHQPSSAALPPPLSLAGHSPCAHPGPHHLQPQPRQRGRGSPPTPGAGSPRPGRVVRHELHPVTYFLGFLESEGEVWAPRRLRGGPALTFPPDLQDAAVGTGWRSLRAPSWEQQSPHAWAAEREGGRRGGGGVSCWDGATLCPGAGAQHPHWDPGPPRQKLSPCSWCRGALREVRLAGKLDGTPRQEGGHRGRGERGAPHPRGAPCPVPSWGGARAGCTSRLAPAPPLAAASPLLLRNSMRQRRGRPGAKARAAPRRVRMTRAVACYPEPEWGCEQDQGCLMFRNSPRRREAWGRDGTQSCPTEV